MIAHKPAFLSSPIIRTLPATAFDPPLIDVRARMDEHGLTLEQNSTVFTMRWNDLLKRQKALCVATPKQLETYQFIREFIEQKKYSPSIAEIQEHFGLRSISATWKRIDRLVSAGLIRKPKGQARGLELV